jgi:hypothetical protein
MPIHLAPLSRRQFIAGSLAAGAVAVSSSRGSLANADGLTADVKVDVDRVALISDTHVDADIARVGRGVNMADNLRRACEQVLAMKARPARVLLDGDLAAGRGNAADYAAAVQLLKPLREAGLPIDVALGNCDHREHLRAAVVPKAVAGAPADRRVAIIDMPRARWILLDSLNATGESRGRLGSDQLKWLANALDAEKAKPALVMVHHNPEIAFSTKATTTPAPKPTGIADTAALFGVLSPRRQAKALLFGHTHRWQHERRDADGLHLVNLPACAYVFTPDQLSAWIDARLEDDGARLELRAIDPSHSRNGERLHLEWRV